MRLRSRRLATVLLVAVTVYAWVATLVPLESMGPAAVASWDARHPLLAVVVNALGLHRAYSSPVFLAAALVLGASTAACAWERTRVAVRMVSARRAASSAARERLATSPAAILGLAGTPDREDALTSAADSLRRLRMRVRRGPDLVEATSGGAGIAGSPLFHWALVGLFVFVALGQLTRYEGYVNMLVGDTVKDAPGAYSLDLTRGALTGAGTFTGVDITLKDLEQDHVADGVPRGPAAIVVLTRAGKTVREQWVYPNSPLRYGPLLMQGAGAYPALVGTVKRAQTGKQDRVVLYYDVTSRAPRAFTMTDPATDATLTVKVTPLGNKKVGVSVAGGSQTGTQTIGVGQVATVTAGVTFTPDSLTYAMQLQVVNDWSVYWVYAMFALGSLGAALTVFMPPRLVRVLLVDGPSGTRLHVGITNRANDPAFPRKAERSLREGLTGEGATRPKEDNA